MLTIQQLREKRNGIAVALRNMADTIGAFTPENTAQWEKHIAEMDVVDADIARIQQLLDRDTDRRYQDITRSESDGISEDEAHQRNRVQNSIFINWIKGGAEAITLEQRQFINQANEQQRRVYGALAEGTNSAGGFMVPQMWADMLLARLKLYGGVRELAQVITTSDGRLINYPTTDATSELGERVAENIAATALDTTFGTVQLQAYKYSSKSVPVSFELIQDSIIDIDSMLLDKLATRIGRVQGVDFTTGTGTSQPQGVVTAAGTVAAASPTAISYGDFVELQHAMDPAYRKTGNPAFMFNDAILKAARKLLDTQSHPLWQPDVGAKMKATLLGDQYAINQHMSATMAATNKTVIYGDFSQYIVRDVMQVQLFRFTDSVYIVNGQIGFLAWSRADGRVIAASPSDVFKVLLH